MDKKFYQKFLPLLLIFLFSTLISWASSDGATDFIIPFFLLLFVAFILMIGGFILPIWSIFSKSAVVSRLSLVASAILLAFAIIFITWDIDGFFFDGYLYIALIGFIIHLNKGNIHSPLRSGILLGLYLLLIRLIFPELGIMRSYYSSLAVTALITGLFIFIHFKKQLKPDSTLDKGFSHNDGLKVSLISAAFLFVTYFYYYAAERNLNNWFSFRNNNPVGLLESSVLLEFKGFLFFFCGTFVIVLVTGAIISWGTKKLYLTKAKTH